MKKTAAIFIMMLIVFSLTAGSFYAGAGSGVGVNSIISGENYRGYTYSPSSGYSLSADVLYSFNDWAGIGSGITLSGRNYVLERYYRGSAIQNLKIDNVFIEIPVLAVFTTPSYKGFSLFGSVGGYAGFWAWGKEKGESSGINMSEASSVDQKTDLSRRNRFEAGFRAKLGCSVDFSRLKVQFSLGYDLSLTDMNLSQKKGGYPLYNSTFTVGCALMWRLTR